MLLVRTRLQPSQIDGVGVFAETFIERGTPVWRFAPGFDRMLAPRLRDEFPEFIEKYAQRCPRSGYYVIDMDNARYMNHSDDPNVDTLMPLHDPSLVHRALRDIRAGEELTCDYRIGDAVPFSGFPIRLTETARQ